MFFWFKFVVPVVPVIFSAKVQNLRHTELTRSLIHTGRSGSKEVLPAVGSLNLPPEEIRYSICTDAARTALCGWPIKPAM